jgi:hypothetical protein
VRVVCTKAGYFDLFLPSPTIIILIALLSKTSGSYVMFCRSLRFSYIFKKKTLFKSCRCWPDGSLLHYTLRAPRQYPDTKCCIGRNMFFGLCRLVTLSEKHRIEQLMAFCSNLTSNKRMRVVYKSWPLSSPSPLLHYHPHRLSTKSSTGIV